MRPLKKFIRSALALGVLALAAFRIDGQQHVAEIDKALSKEIDFDIESATLREALTRISKKQKTPIVTDRRALESEWIDDQELKITLQAKGQTLQGVLDSLLTPHGLTWIKRRDVLFITTPKAAADQYSEVWLYKVTRKVPVARRVHSIQTSVAPQSWKVNGGAGDIAPLPPDFIVIRQSPLIHREIAASFAQSIAPVKGNSQAKFGDDALDKALSGAASINAADALLSAILKQLGKKHTVELSIDEAAMTESEIDFQNIKITLQAQNIPRLSSALSLLLEMAHSDLIWIIDRGVINVTTKAAAAKSMTKRTHDASDIIAKVDGKYLVEAIEYNLSPATWQFGGGDGTIEQNDERKLVVHQSQPVHREIEKLLDDLREGLKETKATK
jgi:hypothetical protein